MAEGHALVAIACESPHPPAPRAVKKLKLLLLTILNSQPTTRVERALLRTLSTEAIEFQFFHSFPSGLGEEPQGSKQSRRLSEFATETRLAQGP